MFRLLGFLVGSIASIALLVMLIGVPSFKPGDDDTGAARFDVVIQQLKDKQRLAGDTGPAPDETTTVAAEADGSAASGENQPAAEPLGVPDGAETNVEADSGQPVANVPDPGPTAAGDDRSAGMPQTAQTALAEPGWQPFWNPFRSEIAAEGFVSRLEDVTGLDYRVVRKKTGVYEVAFSYHDDDERSSKLSQIAAATGLDLADASR